MIQDYSKAKRLGEKAYRHAVLHGRYPYLPSLEEMVQDVDRFPEIPLGTVEIPLDMIVGTRTSGRQNAFAANFMPLMGENTEFATKWSSLYDSQVEEGIREPVKAYEFMNRFYVEEGNKRVSVMRYVGAVSIPAKVIRIRPPKTDDEPVRIYYEYLDFYKVTGMFEITFSESGRYAQLAQILGQNLQDPWPEDLLEKLHAGLIAFKSAYLARGGGRLRITTGDALLIYLGVYSLDSLVQEGGEEIGRRLQTLWKEFAAEASPEGIALIERREDVDASDKKSPISRVAKMVEKTVEKTNAVSVAGAADLAGALAGVTAGAQAAQVTREAVRSGLSTVLTRAEKYSPSNPLRIAFLHEKSVAHSGWVYGHELGRNHLDEAFESLVKTMSFADCVDEASVQKAFAEALAEGCSLIFTTSPSLTQASVRFALAHPEIRVLNCSYNQAKQAVRLYYGKMYEAKFMMGALAASLTDDHRIGYFAGRRDPAAVANINAFALGAQLTDPYSRITLEWSPGGVRTEAAASAVLQGAEGSAEENALAAAAEDVRSGKRPESPRIHIFSDIDMVRLDDEARKYGLYLLDDDGVSHRLAAPIWNWGVFYEIVVRKVLNGTYEEMPGNRKDRAVNYWLGMSSGLVDVIFSDDLPGPSYRLVAQLRRAMADARIHPFAGRILDQEGKEHGKEDGVLDNEAIMSMDWLVENVDGSLH